MLNEKHALLSSNLFPRTLKIAFKGFKISKFSWLEHAQTPSPPKKKGTNSSLLIQSVTLFKPAGYFSFYWNPWLFMRARFFFLWREIAAAAQNNNFWLMLLRARIVAHNRNLQVIITHASHLCSQHSFGIPLWMYGMHKTHFDHAWLDLLSLVFWCVFWLSVMWNLRKAQRWCKSNRCCPYSVTFGYY